MWTRRTKPKEKREPPVTADELKRAKQALIERATFIHEQFGDLYTRDELLAAANDGKEAVLEKIARFLRQ